MCFINFAFLFLFELNYVEVVYCKIVYNGNIWRKSKSVVVNYSTQKSKEIVLVSIHFVKKSNNVLYFCIYVPIIFVTPKKHFHAIFFRPTESNARRYFSASETRSLVTFPGCVGVFCLYWAPPLPQKSENTIGTTLIIIY